MNYVRIVDKLVTDYNLARNRSQAEGNKRTAGTQPTEQRASLRGWASPVYA
jgi:hypothetical protein